MVAALTDVTLEAFAETDVDDFAEILLILLGLDGELTL